MTAYKDFAPTALFLRRKRNSIQPGSARRVFMTKLFVGFKAARC
jgi:hypothetical protein